MATTPPKMTLWGFPTYTGAPIATNTTLATATRHDFPAINVEIPESGVTFRSVIVRPFWRHANGTIVRTDALRCGVKLGAAAFVDIDVPIALAVASSGDHESFKWPVDHTPTFAAGWSGTIMAVQVGIAVQTASADLIALMSCELEITYTHNDSDVQRAWCAVIPMQSQTTTLTNVQQEIGRDGANPVAANQIPILNDFIAERQTAGAVPTILGAYLRFRANDSGSAATTDFTPYYQIDATAEVSLGLVEQALATACYWQAIATYDTATHLPSAAHSLSMRSDLTGRIRFPMVELVVVWKYSETATTQVTCSTLTPWSGPGFRILEGASSAESELWRFDLHVGEPGTVTLLHSAVEISFQNTAAGDVNPRVWAGSQAERTYDGPAGAIAAGEWPIMHRVDHGSGWTLTNGENELYLRMHAGVIADSNSAAVHGIRARINYKANKPAGGSHLRNSTTHWYGGGFGGTANGGWGTTGTSRPTMPAANMRAPVLPSHYRISAWFSELQVRENASFDGSIAQVLASGELGYPGSVVRRWNIAIDGETSGMQWTPINWLPDFKTWDQDPIARPLVSQARETVIRLDSSSSAIGPSQTYILTMHACDWTITDSVTGYTGDGSGLTVDVRRASDDKWVASATTAVGGGFTAHVYEGGVHICDVRQDSTHVGRSDNVTPTG